jgi:hypothetical protein
VDVDIYTPNRSSRRSLSGQPCAICGLKVHFAEVAVATVAGSPPRTIHLPCVNIMNEMLERAVSGAPGAEEEDAPEATTEASSVPQEEA